ncbi:MAG: hypothetical protein ACREQO_17360, partial [Candidatus Binatia bacterium]
AITTEILCGAGAQSLIRVGSCGSLQEHIKIGDLVIVTGALRGDGTSRYYVAENFSTVADGAIVSALSKAAEYLQVRHHLGWIFTTDALFQETPQLIEQLHQQTISSIDMVTSTFLTVAQVRGKKAGAVLAVSDECLHGKFGFRDAAFFDAEQKTIEVARQALRYL